MGANAQTSVPLFVANAVLTAAQQNISAATGVPVFATTVTRDAAFGGSNKALAEGQLCYLESTDVVQYYNGSAWATVGPGGTKIGQVVSFSTSTQTSSNSTTFVTTGLTASITPTLNTSKVLVIVNANTFVGTVGYLATFTLFRGTVAGTNLGNGNEGFQTTYVAGQFSILPNNLSYLDSPATTSATSYTFGMRSNNALSTVYCQAGTGAPSATGSTGTITLMEVLV
jgi:hypothetical protein